MKELKSDFRKVGININSIKKQNSGLMVNYYYFDIEGNYRTSDKNSFFNSEDDLKGWLCSLEEK